VAYATVASALRVFRYTSSVIDRVLTRAAASVDRVVARALLTRNARARARSGAESLGHDERMQALEKIQAIYDRPEHFETATDFFPSCTDVTPEGRHVRTMRYSGAGRGAAKLSAEVVDLTWPSRSPLHCADVANRFEHVENRDAAARLFAGQGASRAGRGAPSGRPAVVLIHGYRAGQFAIEQRVWPISWLLRRGFDVALFVLPFHGVRAPRGRGPMFPSSDPRVTNECLRQAMVDLRVLRRHLLSRGAPEVGVMGMSLGGYTTALAATVDDWAFAVPLIPLASFADMALRGGRFVGDDDAQRAQHQALEAAHRVVSPLARAPLVAPNRLKVIAAEGDQVTTVAQARKLADHFGVSLELVPGGHILQFGRRRAFKSVGRMFTELSLGEPRS